MLFTILFSQKRTVDESSPNAVSLTCETPQLACERAQHFSQNGKNLESFGGFVWFTLFALFGIYQRAP